LAVIDCWVR